MKKACCGGKCCKKHGKHGKKLHILPILALLTGLELIAPKVIKKSLPGKALKYSLIGAWGCIAAFNLFKVIKLFKPKKKK